MSAEVYRGYTIEDVPCNVRGHGWRVRNPNGEIVLHHVGIQSLARGVVDALLFDFNKPPASPSSKGQTE